MQIIQQYLADVQQIHSSGLAVKETSYYPALEKLFNGAGKTLKPAVFCVINISGGKAGIPDGGFFTVEEKKLLEKDEAPDAKSNFLNAKNPQRGVLEVKGDAQDLEALKNSAQVAKYLERYGLCLICNLRHFMLLECDKMGGARLLPSSRLIYVARAGRFLLKVRRKLRTSAAKNVWNFCGVVCCAARP